MFSKREAEGELKIDHRESPGITPEQAAQFGTIPVGRGMVYHSATITCSHCQRQVVLNPQRNRDRGYCPKCDAYLCDLCEAERVASGGFCKPFKQVIDEALEQAFRGDVNYNFNPYPMTRPTLLNRPNKPAPKALILPPDGL